MEGVVAFIIPLSRIVFDNWLESPWWPAKLWEKDLIFCSLGSAQWLWESLQWLPGMAALLFMDSQAASGSCSSNSAECCQSFATLLGFSGWFVCFLCFFFFFFPLQALTLSYPFYVIFFFLSHHAVDCSSVSITLVRPEQDQPVEADEECKTPGNKNSLLYILHVN